VKPIPTFLGDTRQSRQLNGCNIALTGYTGNAAFEEWHAHENSGISFLLHGTHQEDLLGKTFKRLPGDLKFIPAGERHRCTHYTAGTRKINIDFDQNFINRAGITEEQLLAIIPGHRNTKFTLLKLYGELNDRPASGNASAELLLYTLLNPEKAPATHMGKILPEWAERLKQLLHDEWDKPFHLDDLGARLGVHPVTISRYFPIFFASTLGVYMNQIKIDKALGLIKHAQLPLTAIAYRCGFADQAHFTRTFKTVTGCLPKTFRNL
jgi:AraC family transcriptional regulator